MSIRSHQPLICPPCVYMCVCVCVCVFLAVFLRACLTCVFGDVMEDFRDVTSLDDVNRTHWARWPTWID